MSQQSNSRYIFHWKSGDFVYVKSVTLIRGAWSNYLQRRMLVARRPALAWIHRWQPRCHRRCLPAPTLTLTRLGRAHWLRSKIWCSERPTTRPTTSGQGVRRLIRQDSHLMTDRSRPIPRGGRPANPWPPPGTGQQSLGSPRFPFHAGVLWFARGIWRIRMRSARRAQVGVAAARGRIHGRLGGGVGVRGRV